MANKYQTALAYEAEKLFVIVYNVFESQIYIVAREEVYDGDITQIKSEGNIGEIAALLASRLEQLEAELGSRLRYVDLIIDPNAFYFEDKVFSVEFGDDHSITKKDVEKIVEQTLRYDSAKSGYAVANFTTTEYIIDGKKKLNPVGAVGNKFEISGEFVYVDEGTLYPLERILEESKHLKRDILVSSHLLKYVSNFSDGDAIIEFGNRKMKFISKSDGLVQNFAMDFGIGDIYGEVYTKLLEEYDSRESEEVVRYLQRNLRLSNMKFDFEIVPGISYNKVEKLFRTVASESIQLILLQLVKKGIEIKRIYSISDIHPNEEWVAFLKTFLEKDIQEYKVPSIYGNFRTDLKVSNAIVINDKIKMKG